MTPAARAGRPRLSRADVVLALACGMLVGLPLSLGMSFFSQGGNVSFASTGMWARGLAFGLVAAALFSLALVAFDAWTSARPCEAGEEGALARHPHLARLVLTVVILALWVPAFACVWPGDYTSDAPIQVTYFLNDGVVDLHWPAAHTLLLLAFFKAGAALFGTYDAGLALFCAAQGALCAFALAYSSHRLATWGVPRVLVAVLLAFVVLNPVVQTYVFATTKDTLFMPFLVLALTGLADVLRASMREEAVRPGVWAMLLVAFVGMVLMRKQALYVLVVALPFLVVALSGARPRLALTAAVALTFIVTSAFSAVVSSVFTVRQDSVRETLSLPSQQVVRAYMLDHDSMTPELIDEIGTYYDLGALEAGRMSEDPWVGLPGGGAFFDARLNEGYLEPISDPAKAALLEDAFARDKLGYARMWLDVMRGHEGLYAEAFLWGFLGYLYPGADAANYWTGIGPWNEKQQFFSDETYGQVSDYAQTAPLGSYRAWLFGATNSFATVLTHMALPFYALLASAALLLRRRAGRRLMSVWFVAGLYWAVLCLAPVACLRYALPLFGTIPLLLGMPLVADNLDKAAASS